MADALETKQLAELRSCAERLRVVLAEERAAIVKLDRAALTSLAAAKLETAAQFATLQTAAPRPLPPELDELIAVLRLEARVTATMSTLAAEAVRGAIDEDPEGRATRDPDSPPGSDSDVHRVPPG